MPNELDGASPDIGLAERLFDEFRRATHDGKGITRMSYGPGEAFAHDRVRELARELDLETAEDAGCNLYLTCRGQEPGPAIMVGSHLDSVPAGGNYDGLAGVAMGLAVLAGFRRGGVLPRRDVTVIVTRAEESTWFPGSFIGSRAAFGRLGGDELDSLRRHGDGVRLGDAIRAAGGNPERLRAGESFLDPQQVGAFVEPHIEQGPVLLGAGVPVGIVTGIRGSVRFRSAVCRGTYAHSGATPRDARQDAVRATAELVDALDRLWEDMARAGHDLSITVGQFATDPAHHALSKVSGRVDFAVDMRSRSPETLDALRARIGELALEIGARRRVDFDLGPRSGTTPAMMSGWVQDELARAGSLEGVKTLSLACGAGHDAGIFAGMGIPSGMLFIRNENGSHNPDEHMELDDFASAARILSRFCRSAEPPVP